MLGKCLWHFPSHALQIPNILGIFSENSVRFQENPLDCYGICSCKFLTYYGKHLWCFPNISGKAFCLSVKFQEKRSAFFREMLRKNAFCVFPNILGKIFDFSVRSHAHPLFPLLSPLLNPPLKPGQLFYCFHQ